MEGAHYIPLSGADFVVWVLALTGDIAFGGCGT
jgi:hypothetical protein